MTPAVAGLVLAAGEGRRLGRPKALVELGGVTLLQRAESLLEAAGCAPVLVVLGAEAELARPRASSITVVEPGWREGVGASLRAGLSAVAGTAAVACVVVLVDQPGLEAEAVRRLIALAGSVPAAVATYGGMPGHPVLLSREVWPEVAALATGDVGAREWLRRHADRVMWVACDGAGRPDDVDTPHDMTTARPEP